jgi:heme O synthase-like polyprenyltransferase
MLKWVTSSTSTFLKVFIWTTFTVIASIVTITNALSSDSYLWIGIVAGVLSLLCIWGLIKTFEIETEKIYPSNSKHSYY